MGMPSINIIFKTQAATSLNKSQRGVVAVILRDALASGGLSLSAASEVPEKLTADNRAYLERAFIGYVEKPSKVLCYVLSADADSLSVALDWLATQQFDYLAGPPDITDTEMTAVVTWIKAQRTEYHAVYKAVLPGKAADCEAIINFEADEIQVGDDLLTGTEYCSRIAGMLAGTPLTYSCTYAQLDEVADAQRLTQSEMDKAVDAGKLILYANGRTVRLGRAVNSLTTTTDDKGACYRKIKIVEATDMIQSDLRDLIERSYIGKYPNSYDNKLVLLTAVSEYLDAMVAANVVSSYSVGIDLDATAAYLRGQSIDTSTMSDDEIKQAPTGSHVFISGSAVLLDAIEDVDVTMSVSL